MAAKANLCRRGRLVDILLVNIYFTDKKMFVLKRRSQEGCCRIGGFVLL